MSNGGRPLGSVGIALSLLLWSATLAAAQPAPASPSEYLENIETQGDIGGPEGEADAGPAQAEAMNAGGNANLSKHARDRIEEIVVRVRKRDELLEDTPVSVTALSENTLREAGVVRLDQIQELVPNLQFLTSNNGQAAQVRIRGIGTSTNEIAFDPGVGIYVDGVFIPRALGSIMDTVDVQQVEVLRGPQGTLFGKNTVGGAINITTIKPSPELEAFAMVRPGNLGTFDGRMMLNVPVSLGWFKDKLFSRVAFASRQTNGYVDNTLVGQTLSNRNSLAFLGSLRFLPVEDLSIDVSGSWASDQNAGLGPRCRVANADAPLVNVYPGYLEACEASEPFEFEGNTSQLSAVESYGTWGTATWDIGDLGPLQALEAKSITSWREQKTRLRMELDGTRFPAVQLSSAGGTNPLDGPPGFQRQISQEVQLGGSALGGDLHYVLGFFALWEKGLDSRTVASGLGVLNFVRNNNNEIDNWTWAPFAQATYEIMEWVSVTGGLRYTEDKKSADVRVSDPTNPDTPPELDTGNSAIFTSWTPMGSLSLRAPEGWLEPMSLDHLMGYFTYSRGFKGGGFNAIFNPSAESLDSFEPETLDSFEFGVKTIGWEQRITFNASVFLGKYDNIQVTSVQDLTMPGDEVPNLVQLTQNAAKATTKGAELELIAFPTAGLRLNGSVGLLDTSFDSFPNAIDDVTGKTISRAGQTFRASPKLQTHVSAQYSFEIDGDGPDWLDGWLTPRVDWYYQSFMHFEGEELTSTNQAGYNLLHARLSFDFLDDRAQIALWGRNLADQRSLTVGLASVASSWGIGLPYFAAPRTYGAEISYRL